jgi:hypothetical protein
MFLNILSSAPSKFTTAAYELPKHEVLRTVSATTTGNEICVSNIKSLLAYTISKQDKSSWLDNSTIYEVLSLFAAFLGDRRNFVMNSDASHGLIQYILYPPKDGVADIEDAHDCFRTRSKRTYQNMFSSNDMCIHIAVNEPQRSHWNFVLVLLKQKSITVHDPMYSESTIKGLGDTIFKICCLENTQNGGAKAQMANWFIKTSIQHSQQPDVVSCGVFSIISSMRAMVLIVPIL